MSDYEDGMNVFKDSFTAAIIQMYPELPNEEFKTLIKKATSLFIYLNELTDYNADEIITLMDIVTNGFHTMYLEDELKGQ